VAADLNELIAINAKRPYFLLVHVRESNDVNSLVEITKQLDGPVEIVPVDVFPQTGREQQDLHHPLPAADRSETLQGFLTAELFAVA
jgi:hypothetical protein